MMISGIYKQTPPIRAPRKRETVLYYENADSIRNKLNIYQHEILVSVPTRERKETKPHSKKRKRNMASNKPKTVKVSKEIRIVARAIYMTWIECTKVFRGETAPIFIPNALKSDTQPLNHGSLEARICAWVEQNPEDYQEKWKRILTLMMDGDSFMHKGCRSLQRPTLSWLFGYGKGDWGINRVLNQEFDWLNKVAPFRSEDGI
jgi:hypothetical protein